MFLLCVLVTGKSPKMHPYRTHTCGALRYTDAGIGARLSGWVHRKRDHGNLLFVDLRDNYGITQCVVDGSSEIFPSIEALPLESVVSLSGDVVVRSEETINPDLPTGEVELGIVSMDVLGLADPLPMPINQDAGYPEDIRLRYRFLDLRREEMHRNILLRAQVIQSIRMRMIDSGFTEFQTPILTASSPEGARDYLVPSRHYPGQFYALPQAPQQFKQMLMVAGFDRYFQIAPCFRDEDARADRSPGEFYQLDFEMSFVTQEDIFAAIEPVLGGLFEEFSNGRRVTSLPFPRIPFDEAMLKYGSDKPDLRNPLIISDVTESFRGSNFKIFSSAVDSGSIVRAIPAPGAGSRPRSFFDNLNIWAREEGAKGLGYVIYENDVGRGPIANNLSSKRVKEIAELTGIGNGDAVFFVCDKPSVATTLAAAVRMRIGSELGLIENDVFHFCWVVDYPLFELDEEGSVGFSHNPFSMPQGGLDALDNDDPLSIKAFQYDIVCNGIELSSGAVRNHSLEIMYRAFEIAGYSRENVELQFGGMLSALRYGAPPHGGAAPGIDRIVMLLANEDNLREVVAFPMNQQAQDLTMGAPAQVDDNHLRDLHLRVVRPPQSK